MDGKTNVDNGEEILIDFGKICRFCLAETDGSISILDKCLVDESVNANHETISSFMTRMTLIKMSEKQNFPLFVCNNCYNLVNICYNFNIVCHQSDLTLRDCYLQTLNETKAKLNSKEPGDIKSRKSCFKNNLPLKNEGSLPNSDGVNQPSIKESDNINYITITENKTNIEKRKLNPTLRQRESLNTVKANSIKQKYQKMNTLSERLKEAQSKLAQDILRSNDLMLEKNKNNCASVTTNNNLPHTCPQCSLQYPSMEELKSHYLAAHGQIMKLRSIHRYMCNICPKTFIEHERLLKHYKIIHKKSILCDEDLNLTIEKPVENLEMKFHCLICTPLKMFQTRKELSNHLSECHEDKQKTSNLIYNCTHCDSGPFPTRQGITKHLKHSHMIEADRITWKDVKCVSEPEENSGLNTQNKLYKVFVCTDCSPPLSFTSIDNCLKHKTETHDKQPENIPFKELPAVYVDSLDVFKQSTETLVCGYKLSCKNCVPPMDFDSTSAFVSHMHSRHGKSAVDNWDIELKSSADGFDKKKEPEQKWKCSDCSAVYFRRHSLYHHMREKHKKTGNLGPIKCPDCDESFFTNRQFIQHGISVHQKYFAHYHKVYKKNILHPATEDEDRIKNFECDICEKKYVCKNSLKRHLLKAHLGGSETETAVCPYCGKTLSSKLNLKSHIEFVHEALFVSCPLCKKKINFKTIGKHYKTHQINSEFKVDSGSQFLCNLCGKILKSKRSFEDHQKLHKNIRDQLCDICGSGFTTKKFLQLHKKTHEGAKRKVFGCPQCDKVFSGRHTLNRHLLTHSGEKNFICEICSKCFYTLQELNRHVRYHKKEYRFDCQLCDMRFLDKSRFRHHMMRHRNIRPHKCQFCDKMFIVRRKMNLHMAAKHNVEVQSTKAVWKDPKTYISLDDLL